MKKLILTIATLGLPLWTMNAQTGADFMKAFKKADVNIPFDVTAKGQTFRVKWGMDTAWNWDFNVNKGIAHIGKGNFETDARMIVKDLLEHGVLPQPPKV